MQVDWWKKANIYELYVDKFAKDFNGLTSHLDYFTYLGINTLHILPHYPSPMVDDGYDISDYRGVRGELGTLSDFATFVKAAHTRGVRVITDLVINHVSSKHHWFETARASKNNSKRDYFLWSDTGAEFKDAVNPFIDFKPSNWIWNEPTQDYYYATFYPEQPDLNWDNPKILEEILVRIDFWVDQGVDGFRLDAIPHLIEREGTTSLGLPETHAIIKVIRAHLDTKYGGRIALLAEVGALAEEAEKYFGTGDECQMVYHFALEAQALLALKRKDMSGVNEVIKKTFTIPENCQWVTFLRNHDEITTLSLTEEESVELINFVDPHHQYPFNKRQRASVRLGTIFAGKPDELFEALQLLYSLPGSPVMYYGDEIGMENLPPQSGISDTRKYVRGVFDWDTAERMMADPNSLLNRVAALIRNHA